MRNDKNEVPSFLAVHQRGSVFRGREGAAQSDSDLKSFMVSASSVE